MLIVLVGCASVPGTTTAATSEPASLVVPVLRTGVPVGRATVASEIDVANASIIPESVEPSFAIVRKISPGCPSSYSPTVM